MLSQLPVEIQLKIYAYYFGPYDVELHHPNVINSDLPMPQLENLASECKPIIGSLCRSYQHKHRRDGILLCCKAMSLLAIEVQRDMSFYSGIMRVNFAFPQKLKFLFQNCEAAPVFRDNYISRTRRLSLPADCSGKEFKQAAKVFPALEAMELRHVEDCNKNDLRTMANLLGILITDEEFIDKFKTGYELGYLDHFCNDKTSRMREILQDVLGALDNMGMGHLEVYLHTTFSFAPTMPGTPFPFMPERPQGNQMAGFLPTKIDHVTLQGIGTTQWSMDAPLRGFKGRIEIETWLRSVQAEEDALEPN